jgi:hypothetical protein
MKPMALVRGSTCGCLLVVLLGLKDLFIVLSFGFLRVSLDGFSFLLLFFSLLAIVLYTLFVLKHALRFL